MNRETIGKLLFVIGVLALLFAYSGAVQHNTSFYLILVVIGLILMFMPNSEGLYGQAKEYPRNFGGTIYMPAAYVGAKALPYSYS